MCYAQYQVDGIASVLKRCVDANESNGCNCHALPILLHDRCTPQQVCLCAGHTRSRRQNAPNLHVNVSDGRIVDCRPNFTMRFVLRSLEAHNRKIQIPQGNRLKVVWRFVAPIWTPTWKIRYVRIEEVGPNQNGRFRSCSRSVRITRFAIALPSMNCF